MNDRAVKPGISILIFVVLISSFLLVCTGVWRTTAYLVNFTLQRQVYIQNRYCIEGVMRWALRWAVSEWDVLGGVLDQKEKIFCSLNNWPFEIEHLKSCKITITIRSDKPNTCHIEAMLLRDKMVVFKSHCKLFRHSFFSSDASEYSFLVHDWSSGV